MTLVDFTKTRCRSVKFKKCSCHCFVSHVTNAVYRLGSELHSAFFDLLRLRLLRACARPNKPVTLSLLARGHRLGSPASRADVLDLLH